MHPVQSFVVKASLPESIGFLRDLAYNLGWYWNVQAVRLFRRLDPDMWEKEYHNPVSLLGSISQERLKELAADEGFHAHYMRVLGTYDKYLEGSSWYAKNVSPEKEKKIAYFSLEFGLAECVPIYSGGLGLLAGDHLKSASDLGLPMVAVGLLYQQGYFHQYLNNDGWQQEQYPQNDFYNMPVLPVTDKNGNELIIELDYPKGPVYVKVWVLQVGRVPLYLLDTNLEKNSPEDRAITSALYGGDQEMRLRQEILVGIGGLRALHAMDIWPTVCHMNEGHAAFLSVERIRALMESDGLTFEEAFELSRAGNVFTTHTPVPAGHDRFYPDMVLRYFDSFYPEMGLSAQEFLGLGRIDTKSNVETFCMTVLAMKCASRTNAVSRLHMDVSRRMWTDLWPGFPMKETPISHVTNGVHVSSWVSRELVELFERYLGPRWRNEPASEKVWARINDIPDEEIWRTHERRRERLVSFARQRMQVQLKRRGASEAELNLARGTLNSKALTIGFARRFATYKRAGLLFQDIERLSKILTNPDRPVQLIFAGKAHPRDDQGKEIIRRIIHRFRRADLRSHVIFLEDYDICVARYLVQGVDVWLNNPRRPLEASGTSGMKAAANGALNLSILDGWWDEAYTPEVGWAIGSGEEYNDPEYQDQVESNALYDVLEKDIVPLFYDVGPDGLPRNWVRKMKASMSTLVPVFNTDRMVHEYFNQCYQPAIERFNDLRANKAEKTKALALWKRKVHDNWKDVKIVGIDSDSTGPFEVGGEVAVAAKVRLGALEPDDVAVELYAGIVDAAGDLVDASPIRMTWQSRKDSHHIFNGSVPLLKSGKLGFSLRVVPSHSDSPHEHGYMLVKWADVS